MYKGTGRYYFSCEENCGLFLTLYELQKPLPNDSSYSELLYQVSADFWKLEGKISATVSNSEERQRQELAHLASRVEGLERQQDRTSQEECDEEKEQLREQLKRLQQLVSKQAEDMQSMRQVHGR